MILKQPKNSIKRISKAVAKNSHNQMVIKTICKRSKRNIFDTAQNVDLSPGKFLWREAVLEFSFHTGKALTLLGHLATYHEAVEIRLPTPVAAWRSPGITFNLQITDISSPEKVTALEGGICSIIPH